MKTFLFVLTFVGCLALYLTGCSENSSPVSSPTDYTANSAGSSMSLAKATTMDFTGTEAPIDFKDGRYVGNDKRVVGKGVWFQSIWSSTLPLLDGAVVDYTFNGSFNASGEGPMQGTFKMEVGGGTFEGTVEGKMFSVTEDIKQGNFKYVGHGKGGTIDGMKLTCTETYYESKSYVFFPYGELVGSIK
jgi:hypothetical protein